MSAGKSKSGAHKRRTAEERQEMLEHFRAFGMPATVEKYGITSKGVYYNLAKVNGYRNPQSGGTNTITLPTYAAIKNLEKAITQHRKSGAPPSDLELFATLLLREMMK